MSLPVETFRYRFSDIVVIGARAPGRTKTTWYIECDYCKGQHMFRQSGTKIWHTSCGLFDIEWTITPAEYYVKKPADFTQILGEP